MSRVKHAKPTTQQEGTSYALQMILAVGEQNYAEFNRLALEVGRHRNVNKLANKIILAMTATAASALKEANPETWAATLRLDLHDLDLDPAKWVTDTKEK